MKRAKHDRRFVDLEARVDSDEDEDEDDEDDEDQGTSA